MPIAKINSYKKVIAQLLLLALPTAIFVFYLLWQLNRSYSILQNDYLIQGIYFISGTCSAIIFYSYRFRFLTTAFILFILCYFIYKYLGSISTGEFDAFYFSIQFLIFSILFTVGWLVGFGFGRSKYFTVFWSVLLLTIQIITVSKTSEIKAEVLINAFIPVLAYSAYILYAAELIRNMNEDDNKFTLFISKRIGGFAILLLLLFLILFSIFQNNFKAIEKEWGGAKSREGKGDDKSEAMTKKDKNGLVSNKDQTKLSGSLNKDKQLVFVAKLDNYFADGITPNPLYFTSTYYTKFDTATQTFEIDEKMPYNDLYSPDPAAI